MDSDLRTSARHGIAAAGYPRQLLVATVGYLIAVVLAWLAIRGDSQRRAAR